jgi:predicted enzyme related to lactoylglutathione lyase
MGPITIPDGLTIAHFQDPAGHLIGLIQTWRPTATETPAISA